MLDTLGEDFIRTVRARLEDFTGGLETPRTNREDTMAPNVDLTDARSRAQELLDQVDSPGEPLQLAGDDQITDLGWAWVYEWSTSRWFATRDPDAVPPPGGGPIVVVKDSGDTWMLGSGEPYDEQLAEYARENGYPHTVMFE